MKSLSSRDAGLEATKTGYACASGFDVAVSFIRGGKRVVGVVLGTPSAATRTQIVREILDAGLTGATSPIGNLRTVKADTPAPGTDLRRRKCGQQGPAIGTAAAIGSDVEDAGPPRLRR